MSQNHVTKYFREARDRVQWQLNGSYSLTCTPGCVAAQFNQHGNCTTVDTVVLGKSQAACVSKITVERTTFLPCILMNEMEHNGGCGRCFATSGVNAAALFTSGCTCDQSCQQTEIESTE